MYTKTWSGEQEEIVVGDALELLGSRLAETDAETVAEQFLGVMRKRGTTTLAEALSSVASRLSAAGASRIADQILATMRDALAGAPEKTYELRVLGPGLRAVEAGLSEARASEIIETILQAMENRGYYPAVARLAEGVEALSPRLGEAQASRAVGVIVEQMDRTSSKDELDILGQALSARPGTKPAAKGKMSSGPARPAPYFR